MQSVIGMQRHILFILFDSIIACPKNNFHHYAILKEYKNRTNKC